MKQIAFFLRFFEVPYRWHQEYYSYLINRPEELLLAENILKYANHFIPLHDILPTLIHREEINVLPPHNVIRSYKQLHWRFYQDWHDGPASWSRVPTGIHVKLVWNNITMTRHDHRFRSEHHYRVSSWTKNRASNDELAQISQMGSLMPALLAKDLLKTPKN